MCETIDNYGSVAKVVADFPLVTELHCRLARSYRDAYPDEIEERIASNNRSRDELQALYPFIEWVSYEELTAEWSCSSTLTFLPPGSASRFASSGTTCSRSRRM